jgi:hypothetical protein
MRIDYQIVNAPQVAAEIEGGYFRMYAAAAKAMATQMMLLRTYAVSAKMHGQMINQRTGNLVRNVASETQEQGTAIIGRVGIPLANTAPYARILHEGGTTRAHIIEASEGKTLAFMAGGQMIYRKLVHHPGSKFRPRPYLAAALDDMKAEIRSNLSAAMQGAIQ